MTQSLLNRRTFTASVIAAGVASVAEAKVGTKKVQTVLGPVEPVKLGATLMHEHAPIVDWSELFETKPAPVAPIREHMIKHTSRLLDQFHRSLKANEGPGAIVEATPIRVGRYPQLLKDLARKTKVHIIAASGFWCEALAPQHPWAVRLSVSKDGIKKMAKLFVTEVTKGMEDPSGKWGQKFTNIRAGIIKIGTSTYMRPSERAVHTAAAWASKESGCPITTHTTNGGGLEEAQLLLKHGAKPNRVIIGHQGFQDDRTNDESYAYHRQIADLGCFVQFDRVGHEKYPIETQARQIKQLVDAGYVKQVLLAHDHAPYYYPSYTETKKTTSGWKELTPDYADVTRNLVPRLLQIGVGPKAVRTMLVDNPQRALAF